MSLTVVIPTFNRAHILPETLRSLLRQERVADEILVVDDGSTDDTAEVAETFGPPVRVIRQHNQGPGAARNRGLAEAKGTFIHFFDSDDLASPNLHRIQIKALESMNADIAYSPWVKFRLGKTHSIHPTNHVFQAKGLPRGSLVRALLTDWSTVPIAWLIRRSLAQAVGGFPEELHCGEDQVFLLALLLANARVVHTPDTLVLYRDQLSEKLTNPRDAKAKLRHQIDWGRSLTTAHHLCLQAGVNPARWFGFRRRASLAAKDLLKYPDAPKDLIHSLDSIAADVLTPSTIYALSNWLNQKRDGLTARTLGRRAHRSFRPRAMTAEQHAIASEVAFSTMIDKHTGD
jgi:glycosyltransferase involved in cell wall biosynthesis